MNEEDLSIFKYRMEKEIANHEIILNEQMNGKFEKISVRTKVSGYVDCYIYRPTQYMDDELLPMYFNLHGGGNVLGQHELDGLYCQQLADQVHCAVINMDYCLAPEFKFPKPLYSTYEAISQIKECAKNYGMDNTKIVVGGHSAGGYISTGVGLLDCNKKNINIKGLIIDYAPLKQVAEESEREMKDIDRIIPNSRMVQYRDWYFEKIEDIHLPLASPVYADLHNMPDMLIISAEYDSLAQEEKEFAQKAKEAGCKVKYLLFEDCEHGFTHKWFKEYNEKQSQKAWVSMANFLKNIFYISE